MLEPTSLDLGSERRAATGAPTERRRGAWGGRPRWRTGERKKEGRRTQGEGVREARLARLVHARPANPHVSSEPGSAFTAARCLRICDLHKLLAVQSNSFLRPFPNVPIQFEYKSWHIFE